MEDLFSALIPRMFHVKQLQTEEAAGNLFTDISEVQQVGSEGANIVQTKTKLFSP